MTNLFTYSNQPKRWKRLVRTLQVILLIAMTGVIVSSCSTTSKIPDDDQLFIGLKEIQYKGYDKNTYKDHFIATQTEIERSSDRHTIARRSPMVCGYGTGPMAQAESSRNGLTVRLARHLF